jgi:hypothetical protein
MWHGGEIAYSNMLSTYTRKFYQVFTLKYDIKSSKLTWIVYNHIDSYVTSWHASSCRTPQPKGLSTNLFSWVKEPHHLGKWFKMVRTHKVDLNKIVENPLKNEK